MSNLSSTSTEGAAIKASFESVGFDFAILGSGSKANSYLFSDGSFSFLIDDGYSRAETVSRLRKVGYEPTEIQAIFVTHGHLDHIRGVCAFSRKYRCSVYSNPQLDWGKKSPYHPHSIEPNQTLQIEGLTITAFSTFHDAVGSQGYHFSFAGKTFTLITDTGVFSPQMVNYAAQSDFLFLEANYSPIMLEQGPYSDYLKKRVASSVGHLSNEQACEFLRLTEAKKSLLSKIFFCHLSEKNNSPQELKNCLQRHYQGTVDYCICPRNQLVRWTGEWIDTE